MPRQAGALHVRVRPVLSSAGNAIFCALTGLMYLFVTSKVSDLSNMHFLAFSTQFFSCFAKHWGRMLQLC